MNVTLIALGWSIVALASLRALLLTRAGLTVRASMVASWALLAAGVALSASVHATATARWLWTVGLVVGTVAFAVRHVLHQRD